MDFERGVDAAGGTQSSEIVETEVETMDLDNESSNVVEVTNMNTYTENLEQMPDVQLDTDTNEEFADTSIVAEESVVMEDGQCNVDSVVIDSTEIPLSGSIEFDVVQTMPSTQYMLDSSQSPTQDETAISQEINVPSTVLSSTSEDPPVINDSDAGSDIVNEATVPQEVDMESTDIQPDYAPSSPAASDRSEHSRQSRRRTRSGSNQSSVKSGDAGRDVSGGSRPVSPSASVQSRSSSRSKRSGSRSRGGSHGGSGSRSRSRSQSGSRSVSRSGSRGDSRSKSGSRSGSGSRSRSRSGSRSGSGSRSRSRRGSRSGSGSRSRSRSGSRSRSRSRSGSRSGSGSRSRSRSGSGSRSRSRSGSRSGSGSRSRSRSGSRSGSGSRSRSRSGSGSRSRSRSGSRSRSVSRSRSRSRSVSRSRSGSRSLSRTSRASRSRSGTPSESPRKTKNRSRVLSDSEDENTPQEKDTSALHGSDDESDKESAAGDLIADIFGSSDEDEEFEGFGAADMQGPSKKGQKKKALLSDSDLDDDTGSPPPGAEASTAPRSSDILPDLSSDSDSDEGPVMDTSSSNNRSENRGEKGEFVSDFDMMLEKKKAENMKRRRRKKDIDVINDNDDIIADLIQKMKTAAEEDRELNQTRKPATKKLNMLPYVVKQLKKVDLQEAFLECGVLSAITEWIAPLPDKSLPHIGIRESLLKQLFEFPPISGDQLKSSGVGKAVMYLYKHPKELGHNKVMAGKIINEWSRPIFNLTSNYKVLTKEEREERDYANLPKRRRISVEGMTPRRDIDKALTGEAKALRPGEKGWVVRARVPQPSHKDYVVRPKSNVDENNMKFTSKKSLTRYEKKMREFSEKKKHNKQQRAITISIEGRGMAL